MSVINETENTITVSGELRAGPYVGTGEKSPLTYELSMGLSQSYEESVTYSSETNNLLEQSAESKIMGFYLVPTIKTRELEWYDDNYEPTGILVYPASILTTQVIKRSFDPTEVPRWVNTEGELVTPDGISAPYFDFPNHKYEDDLERLESYVVENYRNVGIDLTSYSNIVEDLTQSWSSGSPPEMVWKVSTETTTSSGSYIEFNIGANIEGLLGVGIEGSFEMYSASTVAAGSMVSVNYANPEAETPYEDIESFDITTYWLNSNSNAPWIPNNRKEYGDTPTFVTFGIPSVSNIHILAP